MRNKGSILITTLWIMAILALLAMGIGFRSSLEVRLSKYAMDRLGAGYLAKAGVVKALGFLEDDNNDYDGLYECGIELKGLEGEERTLEEIFGAEYNKLGGGSFSVEMLDEERKININMSKLSPDSRDDYINILNAILPEPEAEGEEEAPEKLNIINAILDWQGRGGVLGMEHGASGHPYESKKGDFELVEELLLVKGITRKYFEKIKDRITVYGEGKVNANTAPREVLQAIIVHPELVEEVIKARRGPDEVEGTEDDGFWTRPEDFISSLRAFGINERFIVKSDNFRIVSHASVGKVKTTVTCVVNREAASEKNPEELYRYYHED